MIDCLKERSDLDTLFELYCRSQDFHTEQHANLTVDLMANELWRALQMPPESGGSPWDPSWQPPLKGSPFNIAAEFHATVCRAMFRVPFSDFVKYALGYNKNATSLMSILLAVRNVRDSLRTAFQDRPMIKDMYAQVEKALTQRHHPLAHWIIVSSLQHETDKTDKTDETDAIYVPYHALASIFEHIQTIFKNRKLDLVLKRLAALHRRFSYISQEYDWQKWSADLDFWDCVNQILWSGRCTTPFMLPHLLTVDQREKLRFLEGFHTVAEARIPQYSIRQGLEMAGLVPKASTAMKSHI